MITKFPFFYIFGANTDIGKTLFSTALCKAAVNQQVKTKYIKPVQTGYPTDDDATFISTFVDANLFKVVTYAAFPKPISPHLVEEKNEINDKYIIEKLKQEIEATDASFLLIEGAGGVASPSLDGNLQCDLYRKILLPIIFIADSKLGGISTTISSIELAQTRGFEIACILLFEGEHKNASFLEKHFENKIPVLSFSNLTREINFDTWLKREENKFKNVFKLLNEYHADKFKRIDRYLNIAKENVWWPFTQHQNVNAARYIDSALNDNICFYNPQNMSSENVYDAHASWWSQGIGHASVTLMKAACAAAGRYGHVMFPGNIHEPAANLTEKLLNTVGNGWAKRVFFSDNGSTANEIAIKMAFRKTFGKNKKAENPIILGLKDSYHGDTLAAMDATSPNTFKIMEYWYKPRGYWLDYPKVFMKNKRYIVRLPDSILSDKQEYFLGNKVEDVFSFETRNQELYSSYLSFIENHFEFIATNKLNIGACMLEGVVMGSGGMQFVDPLFQKILIDECQKRKIPVILDEVFTGFWRLGKMTAAQMLNVKPDIACYGKLLTGGLIPMAVTLATEEIFNEFLHDNLSYALLHGHTYTATPVGCNVSYEAIQEMQNTLHFNKEKNELNEIWDVECVQKISELPNVERVFSLGSLFAFELKDLNADYSSTISKEIILKLQQNDIDARPLGNVVYIIAGYNTSQSYLNKILNFIYENIT